jgi:hypothetical protein
MGADWITADHGAHPHDPTKPHAVQKSQPSLWIMVALPQSGIVRLDAKRLSFKGQMEVM